jgi:thiosulfate/3-mercaptopyruvate sulfurtransferase
VDPLIDPAGLAAARPGPVLLDVRWRLAGPPGRDDYDAGHLPGAVFVDLDTKLSGTPGRGGRHPLPDPQELQATLRAAGVDDRTPVVCYDAGDNQAAARAWWILRWAGHADTRILDGGYAAWVAAGLPVTTEVPTPHEGTVTVRPGGLPVLDADAAAALARTGTLIDARVAPRYRGEVEPVDPVAGHIPGAVNVPAAELTEPDGRLKPPAELKAALKQADGRPVGAYCGSGVTAAHTVLALHRAGRTDAALYVGSWSEWVADPGRPVATVEG